MIDFLKGQAVHVEPDYIVMEVGGIGYRVFCANPYAFAVNSGEIVTVYIHHHVREDAILLYGFKSREEQALFRHLLNVNGIGPRVALGILSAGHPEAVISAIQRDDLGFLTKLPGIGKKTAQRILLDLKDKLGDLSERSQWEDGAVPTLVQEGDSQTNLSEAKQALLVLGYSEGEIERVWPAVSKQCSPSDSPDTIVKKALQALLKV
ncbi:Holliday junction branch migration protein RuvA [Paenibacillus senegalensis]|uniref:Holliday junction branch migration protein RuvA n=1 Tax=Paenibacillus senegalensis TaxID=1465766 RepID=UPI0002880E51|nr:Holliday junction branch migration protein RuvA [Paenibacillus senegalensis]